jgi:hypothetical protein
LHSTRTSAFRKIISNPRHYPAAAITMAAAAIAIAPLTASAASTPAAAAKPAATVATASASVKPAAQVDVEPASAPLAQTRSADPFSGTTFQQLLPNGTDASQSTVPLDSAQWTNATSIVNAAENLHLTPYAATIAVATSLQESKLQNLNVAVDHDSLGLFQQRPSCGWGTPAELENPTYAADAFLKSLPSNYQSEQVDVAAQTVQQSFDGQLYAQWEDQAAHIVYTIVNH